MRKVRSIVEGLSSRMTPRVPRHVGNHGSSRGLTFDDLSFTMNTIRGDKEFRLEEIQPHLNSGLWPVYLEELEMRYEDPPTDGRQEAPGAAEKPNVPASE